MLYSVRLCYARGGNPVGGDMKSPLRDLLIVFTIFAGLVPFAPDLHAAPAQRFQLEAQAKQHCPSDTVVWLNIPTQIYRFKGMRWYGNTKSGAYVCRKEADAEGDRPTRNGQ
jgi:hypothetical protein